MKSGVLSGAVVLFSRVHLSCSEVSARSGSALFSQFNTYSYSPGPDHNTRRGSTYIATDCIGSNVRVSGVYIQKLWYTHRGMDGEVSVLFCQIAGSST